MKRRYLVTSLGLVLGLLSLGVAQAKTVTLLNVSYDPTRELYEQYNQAFAKHWKQKTGDDVVINQSHGGSAKQARSVIDGLEADVVTLALAADIDVISEKTQLLPANWEGRLPNYASPYTSTIVFLVKKGNPKHIKDWDDLIKPGVQVVTPNPKTSGGARWNYLAAYGWALKHFGGNEAKARDYLKTLYAHVPVLDSGARGSTITFTERGVGDVLIAWESDAYLATTKLAKGQFEIVNPSLSILAEPPVSVVDKVAIRKGNLNVAQDYLTYLYSPEAQEIIAQNYYRPIDAKIAAKYAHRFPNIPLITIRDFGGWKKAEAQHFADGGVFDQLTKK